MRKLLQVGRIVALFIGLPFQISNGNKKRAYKKIKQLMISANLL